MTRLGSSISARELARMGANGQPGWHELVSIDDNRASSKIGEPDAPRVLRLWADNGLNQFGLKGFEAQIVQGIGDITYAFPIGSQPTVVANVPSQGLALPVPSGNVRVNVRLRLGSLAPQPEPKCLIYATVSRGAPVVTYLRGGFECADTLNPGTIILDPEDYPFSAAAVVTPFGAGNNAKFGGSTLILSADAGTIEIPMMGTMILTNPLGSGLVYQIKQVW